jgi:hypothetical protein
MVEAYLDERKVLEDFRALLDTQSQTRDKES